MVNMKDLPKADDGAFRCGLPKIHGEDDAYWRAVPHALGFDDSSGQVTMCSQAK